MDGGKHLGAYRAVSGIRDALVLSHVPIGCHWGAGLLKCFSNQNDMRGVCTDIHEKEIIFGTEPTLKMSLLSAKSHYNGQIIILLTGDVSCLIGDDCRAMIQSEDWGSRVVLVEAPGIKGSMRDGYEDALMSLAPFMNESKQIPRSINLIGYCPDDFKADADIKEIKQLLDNDGISINCVISNCSYEEFIKAPAAELNVVLGQGIRLAKFMETNFDVPYMELEYPYGIQGTTDMRQKICNFMDIKPGEKNVDLQSLEKIYLYLNELYGSSAAIIGDFRAKPMARFLSDELGFDIAAISSFEEAEQFEESVLNSNALMLFGSSFEKGMANSMGIPLVRFVYPVFDQVSISDSPFAGIRGTAFLIENIVNSALAFRN